MKEVKEITDQELERMAGESLSKSGLLNAINAWSKDTLRAEYFDLCVKYTVANAKLEQLKPERIILPN